MAQAITAEPDLITEAEPNNAISQAMTISLPARITGVIASAKGQDQDSDVDIFRFRCQTGEVCIFEVLAARDQSALDSVLDILDASGQPVLQTRLQAVRQSYFTFRGQR